jgi:hypothetical protein
MLRVTTARRVLRLRIGETASTYAGVGANILNKEVADSRQGVVLSYCYETLHRAMDLGGFSE